MQRKRASVNCVCRCAARTGRDIVLPDARGDPRFNPKLDQDMACAMTISLMCLSVCLSVCLCLCSSLSLLTSVSERFARGLCVSLVRARSLVRACSLSCALSSSDGYVDLYVGATVPYFLKDGCMVNENNVMINADFMGATAKVSEVKNYI